jgi:hypothetical protein
MINKIDEVINALKDDATLTNLVNKRVYWLTSANSTTPYITLFEVTNSEAESADDEEYADDIEIQVDVWSKGSTIPIAKQVQKVMRGLGFTHDAAPDEWLEDTKIYHKPLRFSILQEV